jgi:peroxiredoxin
LHNQKIGLRWRRAQTLKRRRIAVRGGFVMGLMLLLLAPAGGRWTSRLVVRSQGNEDTFESELRKGQELLRRHRFEDALKIFKHANEMRNKQSAECFYGMAQAYQGLEAYKNVAESCDKVIEFSGGDTKIQAQAYNLKGIALQTQAGGKDQKKLQEAEAVFRQGLALGTDLATLRFNLGYVLLQENRDPEGLVELRKYVELAPDGAESKIAQRMIENPRRAREAYAPDFSVTTSEGEYISLDDLHGKVVLLDFWGTWCPPCVDSVPELRDLHKRYAKESSFVMISVSSDGIEEKWRQFIAKNQMTWPQYLDRERKVQRAFEVQKFPSYVVIDSEGIIRYRSYGAGPGKINSLDDAIHKQIKLLAKT